MSAIVYHPSWFAVKGGCFSETTYAVKKKWFANLLRVIPHLDDEVAWMTGDFSSWNKVYPNDCVIKILKYIPIDDMIYYPSYTPLTLTRCKGQWSYDGTPIWDEHPVFRINSNTYVRVYEVFDWKTMKTSFVYFTCKMSSVGELVWDKIEIELDKYVFLREKTYETCKAEMDDPVFPYNATKKHPWGNPWWSPLKEVCLEENHITDDEEGSPVAASSKQVEE